jgi:hypothetical protein
MPANWSGFIKDLSEYLSSGGNKTSKETADKIIDLYIDSLSGKAQPLPGTSFFNSNDPNVISNKPILKEAFSKAMDLLQNDPNQQKATFEMKKKSKEFVDPSRLESIQSVPSSPPSTEISPIPPVDEKYYEEIIANSPYTFFIKQKDGNKSNKIFDFKTKVDFNAPEGYGIPLSLFGNTIPEVISTLKAYGKLPGLVELLTYTDPGYDIQPDILRRGVKSSYGDISKYFVDLYAKGGRYRGIGERYKSVTGATEETISAAIVSELAIIIGLYSQFELKFWLDVASPYMEKTAVDRALSEIRAQENLLQDQKIEGQDEVENKTSQEIINSTSSGDEKDPYSIMANALVLFWTKIGISSTTLFIGPAGVPPSVIPVPNTYTVIFPGIPFILAKAFRLAFNVGANPEFIPEIPFEAFQKNPDAAFKRVEDIGKNASKATSSAIASVFATHLLSLKLIYAGQIPSVPSPIPSPAFVYSVY